MLHFVFCAGLVFSFVDRRNYDKNINPEENFYLSLYFKNSLYWIIHMFTRLDSIEKYTFENTYYTRRTSCITRDTQQIYTTGFKRIYIYIYIYAQHIYTKIRHQIIFSMYRLFNINKKFICNVQNSRKTILDYFKVQKTCHETLLLLMLKVCICYEWKFVEVSKTTTEKHNKSHILWTKLPITSRESRPLVIKKTIRQSVSLTHLI